MILYRLDLDQRNPGAVRVVEKLEGKLTQATMIEMNSETKNRDSMKIIAADFIEREFGERPGGSHRVECPSTLDIDARTPDTGGHLIGHCGIDSFHWASSPPVGRPIGQILIGTAGVIQTIPALALLVFMIPLLKTGSLPAIVAISLYSLLPIINNTAVGLRSIPHQLLESADALGLSASARLRLHGIPDGLSIHFDRVPNLGGHQHRHGNARRI